LEATSRPTFPGKKSSRNTINIVAIVCTSALLLATLIGLVVKHKLKKNRASCRAPS
jgi:hypothetical protein